MKKKLMQKMKNSFQAPLAGRREGKEESSYGEGESEPVDLQLNNYSNEELEEVLRRGDLNLLNNAREYMGGEEFETRLRNFDSTGDKLLSIFLEQDSGEMIRLIMPKFFSDWSVYKMLSLREIYSISADFVKLVLKLHPDQEVFTRDSSEIPMSLFIHSSIAGREDIVEILLSKSEAFLNAFNSQQAEEIFIEYFLESAQPLYKSSNKWPEIVGFLLDKNPAFAELEAVQQTFIGFIKKYNSTHYNNVEFLLTKSPILAALYKAETVQEELIDRSKHNPNLIEFLLRQDPALAENIEMQNAFRIAAIGNGNHTHSKLECLLNIHPRFAGRVNEEMQHNDVAKNEAPHYERVKFLLDRYPALVGAFTSGISWVIRDVIKYGDKEVGFKGSWNESIDNLLKICPDIGEFCTDLLYKRLEDHLDSENLDYEKIEFLLKCNSDVGKEYNYKVNNRFLRDIKSKNLNYEEIKFLLTMFPLTFNQRQNLKDFHELFDMALSDNKTEIIEILLKVAPQVVIHDIDYGRGRSIIEQAKNNSLPDDISMKVLKAACETIEGRMREAHPSHTTLIMAAMIKDSLLDHVLSSALQGNFGIIDLMMGGSALSSREVGNKLLKYSVLNGDTNIMEYVFGNTAFGWISFRGNYNLVEAVSMMCDTALAHGRGEFAEYLVGRFPEIVVPYLQQGNVLESIIKKTATSQGVNIVKHLLFVDELRQGMKVAAINEYVANLKLLCTASKASYFFPLSDDIKCSIGEFLLDKQYQSYARVILKEQSPIPENTLHIKVATEYMAKVIMNIVNECLIHPLVGEQLNFRTAQCTKWLKDKLEKNMGKFVMIPKHLQKHLVHDVWQAITDQPPEHQRTKLVVEQAIDAVLGYHNLLGHDTPALELAGDVYEVKDDAP